MTLSGDEELKSQEVGSKWKMYVERAGINQLRVANLTHKGVRGDIDC